MSNNGGGLCVCDAASGYVAVGGACQLCNILLPGCTQCSSPSVCTQCDSSVTGLSLSGSVCVCPVGEAYNPLTNVCYVCPTCCASNEYYDSSSLGSCVACATAYSSQCLTCTAATCTDCDDGYYVDGVTGGCSTCSGALTGCLTCTGSSYCTSCDASAYFLLSGSNTCSCQNGYTLLGTSCVTCSSLLDGCLTCSSSTACTSCDLTNNF